MEEGHAFCRCIAWSGIILGAPQLLPVKALQVPVTFSDLHPLTDGGRVRCLHRLDGALDVGVPGGRVVRLRRLPTQRGALAEPPALGLDRLLLHRREQVLRADGGALRLHRALPAWLLPIECTAA